MNVLRDSSVRRLSVALAGLAFYLQLAFAGPSMFALASLPGSIDELALHAMCGAAQTENHSQPGDNTPAPPTHDHALFCCLWHPLPGVAPQAVQAALPIAYAIVALAERDGSALVPGPYHGAANARAPPA